MRVRSILLLFSHLFPLPNVSISLENLRKGDETFHTLYKRGYNRC
jgi:hypothetical protein